MCYFFSSFLCLFKLLFSQFVSFSFVLNVSSSVMYSFFLNFPHLLFGIDAQNKSLTLVFNCRVTVIGGRGHAEEGRG